MRDAGLDDPRAAYLRWFSGIENEMPVYRKNGDVVVVRFPDPQGRRDSAGRIIPHEFVVFSPTSDGITSVNAAIRDLWPEVQDTFARVWDDPKPQRLSRRRPPD